jgi:hypothetical protein
MSAVQGRRPKDGDLIVPAAQGGSQRMHSAVGYASPAKFEKVASVKPP